MKNFMVALCVVLLCGCSIKESPTDIIMKNSENQIKELISQNKDCENVGNYCLSQINDMKKSCDYELSNAKSNSWNNGFKYGLGGALIFVALIIFALKRLFK